MLCQFNLTGLKCFMSTLWNRVPSESNHLSPILRAISLNMAVNEFHQTYQSINLFMGLKTQFVKHESNTFQLQLPARCGRDTANCFRWTCSLISNILRTTVSCNTRLCCSVSEENLDILSLQVSTGIETSPKQFLSPEIFSSDFIILSTLPFFKLGWSAS